MNDIIPTPEDAASAAQRLSEHAKFVCAGNTDMQSAIDTVLPLLEAIAAGRVFEARPEPCANCSGHGGFDLFDALAGTDYYEDCPRCGGSGREPGGTS